MEIALIIFFVVIVSTITFIAKTYYWLTGKALANQYLFARMPETIVGEYNMEHVRYTFDYYHSQIPNSMQAVRLFASSPDVITYEKKRAAEKIGRELLEKGFIEVREGALNHHPYLNRVEMNLRVFKDGAVRETIKEKVFHDDWYDEPYENAIP